MSDSYSPIVALPMHGYHKLLREGFRTRDGHLIEWISSRSQDPITVLSRPEPAVLGRLNRKASDRTAKILPHTDRPLRVPLSTDRQRWWVDSLRSYTWPKSVGLEASAIAWNPLASLSSIASWLFDSRRTVLFDLLDDWTDHYAFRSISGEVQKAYEVFFEKASYITANSEKTAELAKRFGRQDVRLVLNGCDPERFIRENRAEGPIKVGYVGKIGRRLDLPLIQATAQRLPDVHFKFAGPVLDKEYRGPLRAIPNLELLGDLHYSKVPEFLATIDVGWVPHRIGDFEVGGDVIKTYEYRAAGLPVLTTPIIGTTTRVLDGVSVEPPSRHGEWLAEMIRGKTRIPRIPSSLPANVRWSGKAEYMLSLLLPQAQSTIS